MEFIPSVEWEGPEGDERPEKELLFGTSGREAGVVRVLSPAPATRLR